MSKKVLLIFQDCVYCEPYEQWMRRQEKFAKEHGIKIIQTPFTAPGAKKLILEGDKKGFEALPYFTDGKGKFSRNVADFLDDAKRAMVKTMKRKKTNKKAKEEKDEAIPLE